ncbi:MAG: DUF2505 domain-containing protein [Nocardioidaceae bacterium]
MDVTGEINYPSARIERVYGLLMDEAFRSHVCEATHALQHAVSVDCQADDTATVVVRRVMPAEVPDFIKKFVGDNITIVQTETWGRADSDGQRVADLLLEVDGQPVRMAGTIRLERAGPGAREVIRGDLRVSLPLIGRRIEPEIAKVVYAAIDAEQSIGLEWLGTR